MAHTSLAVKYRPQSFDDLTGQESIKSILEYQLENKAFQHAYLFTGPAGTGKAQPLYSKILTPNGYISMGDIKLGDKVYTSNGNIASVVAIYPQGVRPIYEITLQDRTTIRVADNHLNPVYTYNTRKKKRENYLLTTLDLIEFIDGSKYKVRVDTPNVDWEYQKVAINPYLLGVLLGDGSLSSSNLALSSGEHDILTKVDKILMHDYDMHLVKKGTTCDYRIQYIHKTNHNGTRGNMGKSDIKYNYDKLATLKGQLEQYGLLCKSIDKHIPKEYLYNCRDVRWQLLQGLYDSDGYTDKGGQTTYSTSSKQLSEDFSFLVRSLGIRDTVCTKPGKYKKNGVSKECNLSYIHYLHIPNELSYCSSKKHLLRKRNRQNEPIRNIVSIKYVGDEECQCIMLDHKDHTYISDDFIPTHNTTSARIFANAINQGKGAPIELDAASHNSVNDIREIIRQSRTQSIDSEYKIFILDEAHSISSGGFQALLKVLEEPPAKAIFILCTTDPEKIPKTILSRVQRFDFHRLDYDGIMQRLEYIINEENKEGV